MNLSYEEGYAYMLQLTKNLPAGTTGAFQIGRLNINYPGYKKVGDYKLTIGGSAPLHTDIVTEICSFTDSTNFRLVVQFLDALYINGTKSNLDIISPEFKHKIFWITLQEEINYPQPRYKGRKLPFQRFYEAALIHNTAITLLDVKARTNNHSSGVPPLYNLQNIPNIIIPSFYS